MGWSVLVYVGIWLERFGMIRSAVGVRWNALECGWNALERVGLRWNAGGTRLLAWECDRMRRIGSTTEHCSHVISPSAFKLRSSSIVLAWLTMLSLSPAPSSHAYVKETFVEVFNAPGEVDLDADKFDKQDWSRGGQLDAKAESRSEESSVSSDDSNEASAEQHGARMEQQEASNARVPRYSTREWAEVHKELWGGKEVKLGQGSYGVVRFGMLTKTGKLTAVKRYKDEATAESRYIEVDMFDLLHMNPHANVLRAIAVIMENSIPVAVASEHCYETLDVRWKKLFGIISARESTHLILHAAQGLSHIHSLGCAHRDVKPQNMLINYGCDAAMTLVIADFGLTKKTNAQGELTTPGLVTWPYRPPEIELLHNVPYTRTCDTWSLGVVARELYTGLRIMDIPRFKDVTTLEHAAIVAEVKDFSQHVNLISSRLFVPLRGHVLNGAMTMYKQSRLPWELRTCQVKAVLSMLNVDATKRPTMKEVELTLFRVQRTLRRKRLSEKTIDPATPHRFEAIAQAQVGLPKEGMKRRSTEEASAATDTEMEREQKRSRVVGPGQDGTQLECVAQVESVGVRLGGCTCNGNCRAKGCHFRDAAKTRRCSNNALEGMPSCNFCSQCKCSIHDCPNVKCRSDVCWDHYGLSPNHADLALRAAFMHKDLFLFCC